MPTYIALMRKDTSSDYSVDFPDFPGCITAGLDLAEASAMAAEALAGHVAGMIEDGEAIPAPSNLDAVMDDPHNRDAIAFLVPVPTAPVRAVRVNVILPEDLITAIDRVSTNRSRFLVDAAWTRLRMAG